MYVFNNYSLLRTLKIKNYWCFIYGFVEHFENYQILKKYNDVYRTVTKNIKIIFEHLI